MVKFGFSLMKMKNCLGQQILLRFAYNVAMSASPIIFREMSGLIRWQVQAKVTELSSHMPESAITTNLALIMRQAHTTFGAPSAATDWVNENSRPGDMMPSAPAASIPWLSGLSAAIWSSTLTKCPSPSFTKSYPLTATALDFFSTATATTKQLLSLATISFTLNPHPDSTHWRPPWNWPAFTRPSSRLSTQTNPSIIPSWPNWLTISWITASAASSPGAPPAKSTPWAKPNGWNSSSLSKTRPTGRSRSSPEPIPERRATSSAIHRPQKRSVTMRWW